jgi:hypothetical protein
VLAGYVMPAAHSRYPNDLLKGVASQLGVRASRLKFELYRYSASLEIVTPGEQRCTCYQILVDLYR